MPNATTYEVSLHPPFISSPPTGSPRTPSQFCYANATTTAGCPSSTYSTAAAQLACLRAAPLASIVAAVNGKPSTCKFLPVIDGGLIPDYPSRLLAAGKFHKVRRVDSTFMIEG